MSPIMETFILNGVILAFGIVLSIGALVHLIHVKDVMHKEFYDVMTGKEDEGQKDENIRNSIR